MGAYLKKINRLKEKVGVIELLTGVIFILVLVFIMLQTRVEKEWVKAEVMISSSSWWQAYYTSPPFWLGESIKAGDKEYDSQGDGVARVLEIREYEESSGRPSRKDFYLTLDLKTNRSNKTGKIKFKNRPLEIGGPIELHLGNTYVTGLVTFIEGVSEEREVKKVIVEGVWENTFPWLAEAIPVGGQMKDTRGNAVAEILDKRIELALKTVETADGRLIASRDPLRRDVYLEAKLKVRKQGNNLYFYDNQKLRIGGPIWLFLSGIDVERLLVTEISDEQGNKLY